MSCRAVGSGYRKRKTTEQSPCWITLTRHCSGSGVRSCREALSEAKTCSDCSEDVRQIVRLCHKSPQLFSDCYSRDTEMKKNLFLNFQIGAATVAANSLKPTSYRCDQNTGGVKGYDDRKKVMNSSGKKILLSYQHSRHHHHRHPPIRWLS